MGADEQTTMADALRMAVTTVDDRGHLLPLEAPQETALALRELWSQARA